MRDQVERFMHKPCLRQYGCNVISQWLVSEAPQAWRDDSAPAACRLAKAMPHAAVAGAAVEADDERTLR
jgi:hypothetical protein